MLCPLNQKSPPATTRRSQGGGATALERDLLVRAASSGDQAAIAELFIREHPRLSRVAARAGRDREDVLQNALLAILGGLTTTFDPDRAASPYASFRAWSHAIARNACRRLARELVVHAELTDPPGYTIDVADIVACRELVLRCLEALDPEDRALLGRKASGENGFTGTERSRISRARSALEPLSTAWFAA